MSVMLQYMESHCESISQSTIRQIYAHVKDIMGCTSKVVLKMRCILLTETDNMGYIHIEGLIASCLKF